MWGRGRGRGEVLQGEDPLGLSQRKRARLVWLLPDWTNCFCSHLIICKVRSLELCFELRVSPAQKGALKSEAFPEVRFSQALGPWPFVLLAAVGFQGHLSEAWTTRDRNSDRARKGEEGFGTTRQKGKTKVDVWIPNQPTHQSSNQSKVKSAITGLGQAIFKNKLLYLQRVAVGVLLAPGRTFLIGVTLLILPWPRAPPATAAAQVLEEAGYAPAGGLGLGRGRAVAASQGARLFLLPQLACPRVQGQLASHPQGSPGQSGTLGLFLILLLLHLILPHAHIGHLAPLLPLGLQQAGVFFLGESESKE